MSRITRTASERIKHYAHINKQSMNLSEVRMWMILKGSPYKFRRQQTLGSYIVDFASISHHLIIEVDGITHEDKREYDDRREQWLVQAGHKVLRFIGMIPFPDDRIYEYVWKKIGELEKSESRTLHILVDG